MFDFSITERMFSDSKSSREGVGVDFLVGRKYLLGRTSGLEIVGCCSACSGYCPHCHGTRLRRCAFGLMYLPKKIPESQKDCTEVMGSEGLCEACVSFCYRGSTREGRNGKRKIDLCSDRWKGIGGFHSVLYTPDFTL